MSGSTGEHEIDVRVVVVDDHPVFRLGIVSLLGSLAGVAVVGEAAAAAQATSVVDDSVDLVLVDVHLGDERGLQAIRDLVRRWPDLKVLAVTMQDDDETVAAAMRAGADGHLPRSATRDDLERAVRWVSRAR